MSRYVLISGSVAFDTIMVFDGYFKDHILPERVHQINVSMLTQFVIAFPDKTRWTVSPIKEEQ